MWQPAGYSVVLDCWQHQHHDGNTEHHWQHINPAVVSRCKRQAIVRVQARDLQGLVVVSTLTLNVVPINDAPRLIAAVPDVVMAEDDAPRDILLSPASSSTQT